MRRTAPLILLLAVFLFFIPSASATDKDYNYTDMAEDGYIQNNAGAYTRDNTTNQIMAGFTGGVIQRGYLEFNITGLQNTTVTEILFYYDGIVYKKDCNITLLTVRPSVTANNTLYWDIGNGTIVASEPGFPVVGDQQVITLSAAAATSLTNALTAGQPWWAIGVISTNETGPGADIRSYFGSSEHPATNPVPTLQVTYLGNYSYTFTGGYYENGTAYGGVDVSYSTPTDSGEFTVNTTATKQYAVEPTMFYWDIGGGYSRYLFSFGSENFTITIPEDTFYVYSFTIKDHTGKTGLGDCYLEAYRAINGTETLIERMKIYLGNPVPLNLVYGRTYHLMVLFADGSRYDWGYFMAGGVDEINMILKAVTFTDQAQILFNHIHVEATRTAAVVTVNYLDDLNHTTWANTTIRIRNGAVVLFAPRTNSSYTVNWGGADADTGYTVTVAGEHTDYGIWGRSFILDPDETYPDPPSLDGIFGAVNSSFIAWVITMISLLTFSVAFKARGLVATMFIASTLNYIGWASWGYDWLAFGWLIAVGVALTAGGKQ